MKSFVHQTIAATTLAVFLVANVHADGSNPGAVDFGKFSAPSKGGEFVEVHVGSNLISMVTKLAGKEEPEVAEVLGGLKEIRVNVIGVNNDNRADLEARVKSIRAELDSKGWERIVTAQKGSDDVGVYIKTRGSDAVLGVVVTVIGANKQAVFVNVVGDLKPEKLGMIGERFNIEPLKKLGGAVQK